VRWFLTHFLVLRGGMLVADLPVDHAALAAALDVGGRRLFRLGTHIAAEREWGVAAIFDIRLGEVWLQSLSDALPDWDLRTEFIESGPSCASS
jgi:hypothetical protein